MARIVCWNRTLSCAENATSLFHRKLTLSTNTMTSKSTRKEIHECLLVWQCLRASKKICHSSRSSASKCLTMPLKWTSLGRPTCSIHLTCQQSNLSRASSWTNPKKLSTLWSNDYLYCRKCRQKTKRRRGRQARLRLERGKLKSRKNVTLRRKSSKSKHSRRGATDVNDLN